MKHLDNVAALVTGAGSGMGAAVAITLAARGAKVAVLDLDMEKAEKIAEDIGGIAVECNVADPKSAENAVAFAEEKHGIARILVNCAGILIGKRIVGKNGPADLDHFNKVIAVNLAGTFNMMRLAAARMSTAEPLTESGERGVIINTASIAAWEGQVGQAAYSASKGGIIGMTLPAARELAQFGIRIMAIAPGIVKTPMITALPQEVQESLAATIPFPKRLATAEEFADLALHIIENEMLNGTHIRLDGANRMEAR